MTQPIQEPSTDRALQGMAYARDQIFRRPGPPSGQENIPWTVGKVIENAYDYGTGPTNITWDVVVNPYTAVFEHVAFGGGFFYQIRVLEDGLYSLHIHLPIDTNESAVIPEYIISVYSPDPTGGQRFHRSYAQRAHLIMAAGDLVDAGECVSDAYRLETNEELEFQVYNPGPGDIITADALGWGWYVEMRKLGPSTMEGRNRDDDPG